MEYPLDNVDQISYNGGVIRVKYVDGTISIIETSSMGEVIFTKGYRSDIDAPIVDHCI